MAVRNIKNTSEKEKCAEVVLVQLHSWMWLPCSLKKGLKAFL